MSQSLKCLMAQINPTVGAIKANTLKIIDIIQTHQLEYDIIIFPELALTGYPPEDLLFRNELFIQIDTALQEINTLTKNCHVIIGHPTLQNGKRYNSASVITNGSCLHQYHKQHLPNYGVFDEYRYFTPGPAKPCIFTINQYQIGLCICEDIWQPGPMEQLLARQVDVIVCINASPFDTDKYALRESIVQSYAKGKSTVFYVNQVGGQDELLFDGQSFVIDQQGNVRARAPAFVEHLQSVKMVGKTVTSHMTPTLNKTALIYNALVCGLKDYVEKNGFSSVLLGLSGGIDSALTLCIAVDALGPSRVLAVMMPSRYTAAMSLEDAELQAKNLQVEYITLSIEPSYTALLSTLTPITKGLKPDVTEENLQARIRCALLMAISNKKGALLLATSNKSETAVGYCTLYGDMSGGLAVLKDVYKTLVYELAHYRNTICAVIPTRVITRAPSAELSKNQTDQDTLPDYATLDAILKAYLDDNLTADKIVQNGYDAKTVYWIIKTIQRNEYKRHQAAPGLKITTCAFDRDWRYPITSGFRIELAK